MCILGRKYDAIVQSGIPILKRYDIPGSSSCHYWGCVQLGSRFSDAPRTHAEYLIPMDSRVEIDAKIAAGYFTSGKAVTAEDLVKTVGRTWEETEH